MKTNTNSSDARFPIEGVRARDHKRYAGEIYLSDFNTGHPAGNIAKRILRANQFDDACRINDLLRQKRRGSL